LANGVPAGAYVQGITEGSPAQKAGLQINDIVTEVDDKKIVDEEIVLATYVNKKKIGESVKLKVWRDKKEVEITVVLEKKG
jgi:serine protease Do